jgi:hypothetical protein
MQDQYKHTLLGMVRIVGGLGTGIAIGWVFTYLLQQLFEFIDIDNLL